MLALTAAAESGCAAASKGAGETLPALLRGESRLRNINVASNIGRSGRGRSRLLRHVRRAYSRIAEVPTLTEAGFRHRSLNWNGMFAPARHTRPIIDNCMRTSRDETARDAGISGKR